MATLPLELIEHICSLLCFHCQNPGIFPGADDDDSRSAKKALAHLCRASRGVCAVAQPFLFHYYSTGNLPPDSDCCSRGRPRDLPQDDDKLPSFLRSLIQRPDLAFYIKTLQLVETDEISGVDPASAPIFLAGSKRVGAVHHAPTMEHMHNKIWTTSPGQPEALRRIQRRNVHHWLEELVILLSPNVEMINVARDSFCQYEHIRDSGASFPSLKLIALQGVTRNQHVHEAEALFTAAPNLETLYSARCSLFDGLGPWALSRPWTLDLGNVRKLVLSEIGFEDLGLLIACCPELRDLEVSAVNIHRTAGIDYWDMSKLLQTLDPVRNQLRRLWLTHSPSRRSGVEQRPATGETSWSFRDFGQLEELAFDQAAIDCRSRLPQGGKDPTHRGLAEMLPSSVKEVHFLYTNKEFMKDLKRLAQDASFWLPALSFVHVGLVDGIDKRDVGSKCIDDVASSFGTADIKVQWDTSQGGTGPLTLIPGGAIGSKLVEIPPITSPTLGIERLSLYSAIW